MPISELPPGYDAWRTASPPDNDEEWGDADYAVIMTATMVIRGLSQNKEEREEQLNEIRENAEGGLDMILSLFGSVEVDQVSFAVEGTI